MNASPFCNIGTKLNQRGTNLVDADQNELGLNPRLRLRCELSLYLQAELLWFGKRWKSSMTNRPGRPNAHLFDSVQHRSLTVP